jgi:dsDNA-binding SOS-regulon protein
MAQDSQLWSDLLTASGAALELSKMYFYISSWKFESSGKPFLDDTIQTTIPVQSPGRQSTIHVPNRSVHSARRTLGPIKCPDRNQSTQYDALLKASDEFARTIQSSAMSKREAWTAYFSFYLPKMCYVLNTAFLTEEQLTEIQKKQQQLYSGNVVLIKIRQLPSSLVPRDSVASGSAAYTRNNRCP